MGFTGTLYLVGATVAGLGFLGAAVVAVRGMTDVSARRVFLVSLLYHPLVLGFMVFDAMRL